MSVVTLQIGQCGNQLGSELYKCLLADINTKQSGVSKFEDAAYTNKTIHKWFSEESKGRLVARAILVDSEPKTLSQVCVNKNKGSCVNYSDKNVIYDRTSGCANWAVGYNEVGPNIIEYVFDSIQKECESCDSVETFMPINSLGGGTGSGVGSYILETLRDQYPKQLVLSNLVLPYVVGEIPVQYYNTILALSKFNEFSDVIFAFNNDYLRKLCSHMLQIKRVTNRDLNKIVSEQIASVLQPLRPGFTYVNLTTHLAPLPRFNLINIKSKPYFPVVSQSFEASSNWETLTSHLKMNLIKADDCYWDFKPLGRAFSESRSRNYTYHKCLANALVSRGNGSAVVHKIANKQFIDPSIYTDLPEPRDKFESLYSERRFCGKDKFCSLLSNNGSVSKTLNQIILNGWISYTHNAYVHQYYNHGVEAEDFISMFVKCEDLLKGYQSIT